MGSIYNYGTYLDLLKNHISEYMSELEHSLNIENIYAERFAPYPLSEPSLTVGWKEIIFTKENSTLLGDLVIQIDLFTLRDHGFNEHMQYLNIIIEALTTFKGYPIFEIKMGEAKFDKPTSSIRTGITIKSQFAV